MALTKFPKGILATPNLGGSAAIPPTTGKIFFVDSNGGTRSDGLSPQTAFATIDAAINKCTANKGDQIWVMPNHAETIASATALVPDVAGIGIYGLRDGAKRPIITFSATTSIFNVSGAGTRISGLKLLGGISAVAIGIDVNADDVMIDDCEFVYGTTTAYDFAICIDVDAYDRCTIENCRFLLEDTAGCNEAIRLDDAHEIVIRDCYFSGDFTNGMIYTANADAVCLDLLVEDCSGYNSDTTAGANIAFLDDNSGIIRNCNFSTAYAASPDTAFDPGACGCSNNFVGWMGDYQAFPVPFGVLPSWRVVKKSVTYDGSHATATASHAIGTVGTYGMFTISGTIEAKMVGVIGTSITGTSGTISVGVTGDTDGLLGISTGTDLDAGEVWIATAGLTKVGQWTDLAHQPVVIAASTSIFHTVATADLSGGQCDFHLYYRPLEAGAYAKAK